MSSPKKRGEGTSCHHCKKRIRPNEMLKCTRGEVVPTNSRKRKRPCVKKYCLHCIKTFYSTQYLHDNKSGSFICPACRDECRCAACRRRVMKAKLKTDGSALQNEADGQSHGVLESQTPDATNIEEGQVNGLLEILDSRPDVQDIIRRGMAMDFADDNAKILYVGHLIDQALTRPDVLALYYASSHGRTNNCRIKTEDGEDDEEEEGDVEDGEQGEVDEDVDVDVSVMPSFDLPPETIIDNGGGVMPPMMNVDNADGDDDDDDDDDDDEAPVSFSKQTKLYDHWCHGSSGIAIEDDTDAKALYDKQTNGGGGGGNGNGGGAEVNEYTRPFMSKIDENGAWDTVFGNGIVSDTHSAYVAGENGKFIEWIIEVNNMNSALQKRNAAAATIQIGISSDLLGETNTDAFTLNSHGYGFDNLGNILHEKGVGVNSYLQFGMRDVIHVILDYSDPHNWRLYAKIGDIEEEDYDDLEASQKMTAVFAKIHPGSYRLAVSLFSQMDALVIESCRIHGHESATFYQELNSYTIGNSNSKKQQEEEEEKQQEEAAPESKDDAESPPQSQSQPQATETTTATTATESASKSVDSVEEKVIEEKARNNNNNNMHMIPEDNTLLSPPPPNAMDMSKSTSASPSPHFLMDKQQSVIVHDSYDERDRASASPAAPPVQKMEDAIQKESAQRIEQQQQSIVQLQQQIESLQTENAQKQTLIDEAKSKDAAHENRIKNLEQLLSEYKENAQSAQQRVAQLESESESKTDTSGKLSSLTQENERLTHELKLATDRMKSLDVKKQEMQEQLTRAIDSKIKLVASTSEEIDHYRHLIQQIAQNKMACQVLSEFTAAKPPPPHNGYY